MRLRERITIVAAAAVAIAVAVAVIATYFIMRSQLLGQVDSSLRAQATAILDRGRINLQHTPLPGGSPSTGGPAPYEQYVFPNGSVVHNSTSVKLPDHALAQSVANGVVGPTLKTVTVDGSNLRMYVFGVTLVPAFAGQTSVAIQLAQPLSGVESVMHRMRLILAAIFLVVVVLAAVLARIATRRVLRPLADVTATVEAIAETEDLERRLEVRRDDEVGHLAARFNQMLERLAASRAQLDASVAAQRQLVADASHELRTPVTSLRTNIEVLLEDAVLDEEDRRRLLSDVVEQSEELSTLVSDLIEVARGDAPVEALEDIRLDQLAQAALERAQRNAPDVPFNDDLQPVAVAGSRERLTRALNNLLDNAALHTAPGTRVDVTVDVRGVTVRDYGEGISARDLPHVFDRFYRGESSRARQGSGLGLAIVRQVAEQHGGGVSAANAPGGGAVFTLSLPTAGVDQQADDDAAAAAPR